MNLKQKAITLLREIDIINNEKMQLDKRKQSIFNEINSIKISIKLDNKHLIGKMAICENSKGLEDTYKCIDIRIDEEFNVIPIFSDKKEDRKLTFIKFI